MAQPFYVELILRQKIMHGDESVEVMSECFSSLMHVEAERSLDFVADYLRHNDEILSQAAAWSFRILVCPQFRIWKMCKMGAFGTPMPSKCVTIIRQAKK